MSQDTSLTEEDIRDILFDAGYKTEEINAIMSAYASTTGNVSPDLTVAEDSDTELDVENAYDALKEIKTKM